MKAFADLYTALDETNKTSAKVAALRRYFENAPAADAAWSVYFMIGRKPRQVVPTRKLRDWSAELAGIPEWLFDESYHAIGDLAETIALVLPPPAQSTELPLRYWVEDKLLPLRDLPEAEQKRSLIDAWQQMNQRQRYVWNKLITGAFRVGVSQALVMRALAGVSGLAAPLIAHRLMGEWMPTADFYEQLRAAEIGGDDGSKTSRPYPFFLAHPLPASPEELGDVADWQAEWKWDGIRCQLIRRAGQTFLWSRGEELVTERYPEIAIGGNRLPNGTVIDGEILAWKNGVLRFGELQKRIGRKTLGKKLLQDVPVVLLAYDLLEYTGEDVRPRPLRWRRERLAEVIAAVTMRQSDESDDALVAAASDAPKATLGEEQADACDDAPTAGPGGEQSGAHSDAPLQLSPVVSAQSWQELAVCWAESRSRGVEGLMLKRLDSPYRAGRTRGDWWKWKVSPYTIDAVLIYAQRGSGKRASLYTDYTFGLWDESDGGGRQLVPVAKAYSGLTDDEIRKVDAFVRRHTTEKFGPVRTVAPEHVFELAFEGIQNSTRHKCGVAVRFPRILRWRTDKKPEDADTLASLKALLNEAETVGS